MIDKSLKKLKDQVFEANISLAKNNLVIFTFGNVSGIDREKNIIAIKPSGLDYETLTPENIVLVGFDGKTLEGDLKPSSDTKTHLELYKYFKNIGGIAHTHSEYATSWAQAKKSIPCFGTTHADYFYGPVPCTEELQKERILNDYEKETGLLIIETFKNKKIDYLDIKACLVAGHGPFTWGSNPLEAVEINVILEEIAKLSFRSVLLNPDIKQISRTLRDKHFFRKHGHGAYYGQKIENNNIKKDK